MSKLYPVPSNLTTYTKRFFLVIITGLISLCTQISNAQTMQWVKQIGFNYADVGQQVAMDSDGNSYVTGWYNIGCDLDPGTEVYNPGTNGGYDGYVVKLDTDGDLLWAFNFGGENFDQGREIAIDSEGNCYVFGSYGGTVDFDPGDETVTMTNNGISAVSIVKLTAGGEFIWAKQFAGDGGAAIYEVTLDADDNIYCAGTFEGTIDFDPGAATHSFTGNEPYRDMFLCKIDSDGNFLWANQIGSTGPEYATALAVDSEQNVYLGGDFRATVDFDPGDGTYNLTANTVNTNDGFIARYDSNGNVEWAKSITGSNGAHIYSLAVDNADDVYLYGNFSNGSVFDPGGNDFPLTLLGGISDLFAGKMSPQGNVLWAKTMGGDGFNISGEFDLDNSGNMYITGNFQETLMFEGIDSLQLTSAGGNDIFIAVIDTEGNFIWSKRMGGPDYEDTRSIDIDPNGTFVVTGIFSETAEFDEENPTQLTAFGMGDIFVVKHNLHPVGVMQHVLENNISVFPNPTLGTVVIDRGQFQGELTLSIVNPMGQVIHESTHLSSSQVQLNLEGSQGIYFLRMTSGDQTYTRKILKY